jgi:hypothetical protein
VIEEILTRLDKVKQHGTQYYSRCPVHQGGSQNLGITEKDGKVLMHCFNCDATGLEVVEALGLPISALFTDPLKPSGRKHLSRATRESAMEDAYFIEIYENELSKGHKPSREEYRRHKLALSRVKVLSEAGGKR